VHRGSALLNTVIIYQSLINPALRDHIKREIERVTINMGPTPWILGAV
jgi:hypothetical protein